MRAAPLTEAVVMAPSPVAPSVRAGVDRFWGGGAVCALAVHAVALAGVLWWHAPAETPQPSRMIVELIAPEPEAPPPPPPPPAPPEVVEVPPPPEPQPVIEETPPVIVAETIEPDPAPRMNVRPPQPRPRPRPPQPETRVPPPEPEPVVTPAPTPPQPAVVVAEAPRRAAAPAAVAPPPDYLSLVYAQIERRKTYPRAAQARRQQGVVHMRFVIDRSGKLLRETIIGSSGSDILDAAAEDVLRRAGPFPPMPTELPGEQLEIVIPLVYALR